MKRFILRNFRIIDAVTDASSSVIVEDGVITEIVPGKRSIGAASNLTDFVIDGDCFGGDAVLMPAFVDLHAHFRDPGFPEKENLESASLAAVAGGYGTVVCMANTNPVIDTAEKAAALRARSERLGLIDLYPVISLTGGMEGRELSGIADLLGVNALEMPGIAPCSVPRPAPGGQIEEPPGSGSGYVPRLLSEDGKDVADDALFLAALAVARRMEIPVSCHCDFGGAPAKAAQEEGQSREVWSRIEENEATRRVIALGKKAGAAVHIAHVSTKEAVDMIRRERRQAPPGFSLTCEASPHHISLTTADAYRLGAESWGRVNPPLREEEDRQTLIAAIREGLIDAIATDHAPHSDAGKEGGATGFTGLETAFGVCVRELVEPGILDLRGLSLLMSRNPAKILKLEDRGLIAPGLRADLVIASPWRSWTVERGGFRSRGNNSPFIGQRLIGKILMTLHRGRIVETGSPSMVQ